MGTDFATRLNILVRTHYWAARSRDMIRAATKLARESDRFGGYAKVNVTVVWLNWNAKTL